MGNIDGSVAGVRDRHALLKYAGEWEGSIGPDINDKMTSRALTLPLNMIQ